MNKNEEKFNRFSHKVMKEADAIKNEMICKAEKDSEKTISEKEIQYLKKAYAQIQESLIGIEKEHNEEVSKAILASKQTLFNRREEILNSVFSSVKEKLKAFKNSEEYKNYMRRIILQGLEQAGQGEIVVYADNEDAPLIEEINSESLAGFEVLDSEEHLLGGCLICNKTKELMYDCSFINQLDAEKSEFLKNYGLSID